MSDTKPINPYESPSQGELQYAEYGRAQDVPKYGLFSVPVITVAAFLGNLPAGIVLMVINFLRVGRPTAAWGLFIFGMALWACQFAFAVVLAKEIPMIAHFFASGLAAFFIADRLQRKTLHDHLANGGKTASKWLAVVITLGVVVISFGILTGVLMLLPDTWVPEEAW